jgi:periplasmic copper chaperone A
VDSDTESDSTAEPRVEAEDSTGTWLGGAGLVVGALALGVAAGALLRTRRTTSAKDTDT